jgi:hypothetical protein
VGVAAHYRTDGKFTQVLDTARIMYQRNRHLVGRHTGKGLLGSEIADPQIT